MLFKYAKMLKLNLNEKKNGLQFLSSAFYSVVCIAVIYLWFNSPEMKFFQQLQCMDFHNLPE